MAKLDGMFSAKKNDETRSQGQQHPRRETKWIHYSKLTDNTNQYRDSTSMEDIENLAALIQADGGVLQNLLVRKIDTDEYEIIAGHHRKEACRYLSEECNQPEFAFLPCTVTASDDVKAEFALYSSNGFLPKSDYERMHELTRMKELIEQHPEEFPHLKGGRMVDRLAKQMHLAKTTVGDYLSIDKNLGEMAMDAFERGDLKKSAALEMASLPKEEQDKLVEQGTTSLKDIKAYRDATQRRKETHRVTITESRTVDAQGDFMNPPVYDSSDSQTEEAAVKVQEDTSEVREKEEDLKTYQNPVRSQEDTGIGRSENMYQNPVQEEDVDDIDYSAVDCLKEQKDVLNMMLECISNGESVSRKVLKRQKYIVAGLTRYVMEEGVDL